MAYVNVAEWKPEQVTEWLKGLDNAVLLYIHSFLNNEVSGQQLLNLRPDDLDHLGVHKLGHQEIILEAVEHLRNFHYELDRENLQLLALRVACRARSLHNELKHTTESLVTTQTLADVANIITAVKPLVCWLDGSPFSGHLDYQDRKSELLKLSLELATVALRDRFSEAPVRAIRDFSDSLASKADSIIQDIVDPLILQPASLDLATLKKRAGDDLGILIVPSFHGVHQIAEIKYSSPAHSCGKIEEGDEVVQVNYQTVVGWQTKQVMALFEECPTDVFLTLKKRPRHTKVYGQIYMKPYRLPSKKRAAQYTRWHDNLPSPRPELLTIPDFEIPLPRAAPKPAVPEQPAVPLLECPAHLSSSDDEEEEDDESFLAGDGMAGGPAASPTSMRLYLPKPRVTVQRRATVTGASPTNKRPPVNIQQFWRELRLERQWKDGGDGSGGGSGGGPRGEEQLYQLRDKSASFGNGFNLDNPPRPSTCLGIENASLGSKLRPSEHHVRRQNKPMEDITESSPAKTANVDKQTQGDELTSILRQNGSCVGDVFDARRVDTKVQPDDIPTKKDVRFGGVATSNGERDTDEATDKTERDSPTERKERGRLDKSHSTPAYDTSGTESNEGSPVEKSFPPKTKPKPPKRNAKRQETSAEIATRQKASEEAATTSSILETINSALVERLREREANVDVTTRMETEERFGTKATGLPDYHEIANGDVMPDVDMSRNDVALKFSFDHPTHYDGVQICVTPPEPPPRPNLTFDLSKSTSSNTNQSKNNFYSFDQATINNFNSNLSNVTNSSQSVAIASTSNSNQITSITLHSIQSVPSTSNTTQSVPSTSNSTQSAPSTSNSIQTSALASSSAQSKPSPSSYVQSTLASPSGDPVKLVVSTDAKHSPPDHGKTGGVGYRAMQVAKSLGRTNKSVFSSASLPSPRSTRKKNALLAKRRNVSVSDLGACDLDGWLFHRRRATPLTGAATWRRAWFALKGSTLYGYGSQIGARAHLMIALPGFTASPAQEVKSRKFAFKVYHTGTVFYFAGETEEELATWLDSISAATVSQEVSTAETVVYSESDDGSDVETPSPSPKVRKFAGLLGVHSSSQQHVADSKSSDIQKKFGSLKKLGRKHDALTSPTHDLPCSAAASGGASLDRKYLRIFGASRHNVPVPTAQFRSYRRVPPAPPPLSPVLPPSPPSSAAARSQFYLSAESVFHDAGIPDGVKKSATFHDTTSMSSSTGPPSYETVVKDSSYDPRLLATAAFVDGAPPDVVPSSPELRDDGSGPQSPRSDRSGRFRGSNTVARASKPPPPKKAEKPANRAKNLDYRERQIHASNPSLLMPSDMSDYRLAAERLREFGIRRNRQREDTSGFVTLEEFMLSRQEEERKQRGHMGGAAGTAGGGAAQGAAQGQRKVGGNAARVKRDEQQEYRGGSPEKFWMDSLRGGRGGGSGGGGKPLKTAQVSDVNSNRLPRGAALKSASQYHPPPSPNGTASTLDEPPLMKLAFEMHLDKANHEAVATTKQSKFRQLFASRSSNAAAKQHLLLDAPTATVVSPGTMQKTLLGSPRLHRAIFRDRKAAGGGKGGAGDSSGSSLCSPASPPFDWPAESYGSQSDSGTAQTKPTMGVSMLGKKPSRRTQPPSPSPSQSSPPPDYPGLEYPPVFEPETYTLTDASSLMRAKKIN